MQDKYFPTVTDNVLKGNVLLERFLGNAKVWTGGEKLRVPIKYQSSSAGGSYSGFDTFSTSQSKTRTIAEFEPKQNYFSVVLSNIQEAVNQGESKVLDLLATEMEGVGKDMANGLGNQIYSDGTGNDSKDIVGLDAAVDDGNGTGTYASLSRSTYTTWVSDKDNDTESITLADMRQSIDDATIGTDKPTLIVSTPTVWKTVEGLQTATLTYYTQVQGYPKLSRFGIMSPGTGQVGDVGFDAMFIRGIPFVKDQKCTSGTVWYLNENHMWFYKLAHPKHPVQANGFAWTGLKEPTNQDASVGQFLLYGNLVTDSCRSHAYMENKS